MVRPTPHFRKLLFALAVVPLSLLLLEGAARLVEALLLPSARSLPVPAPRALGKEQLKALIDADRKQVRTHIPMVSDPTRGWSLPARTRMDAGGIAININSLGMRGAELSTPEPGEVRLLTLGDSSIMGQGVDEVHVFSSLAARLLSQSWKRKVVGVIGATPGYTSTQSLQTLQRFGPRVRPAWVVVGTIWSDVYRRDRTYPLSSPHPGPRELAGASALYRLLRRAGRPWLNSRVVRFVESRDDVGSLDAEDSPTRVPLARYIRNLRSMAALAKKLRARVVFVILPAPMDFDRVAPPETVQQYRLAMRRVASQTGALLLDGPALFVRKKAKPATHFFDQVHPDFLGHMLLGEELARLIADAGAPGVGGGTKNTKHEIQKGKRGTDTGNRE